MTVPRRARQGFESHIKAALVAIFEGIRDAFFRAVDAELLAVDRVCFDPAREGQAVNDRPLGSAGDRLIVARSLVAPIADVSKSSARSSTTGTPSASSFIRRNSSNAVLPAPFLPTNNRGEP